MKVQDIMTKDVSAIREQTPRLRQSSCKEQKLRRASDCRRWGTTGGNRDRSRSVHRAGNEQ